MAHIQSPPGADIFQLASTIGFQSGLYAQADDPKNTALYLHQDIFFYEWGYDTGRINGQHYRLSKAHAEKGLTSEMTKHVQGMRRQQQKESSVFWFTFWSIREMGARLLKPFKSIW